MSKHDVKNSTDEIENEFFTVKTKTKVIKKQRYDIYINNYISAPHEYVDLLYILMFASEADDIHIHINSGGGYCSTTTQIINAMASCKAHIICHAEGHVASCATWIFLAGDSFIIENDIEFMCHYYSGGMVGKGNEIEADAKFSKKYWHKKFETIYKGFMTDEEIKQLIDGKDFYFNEKQVAKRLKIKHEELGEAIEINNTKKKKKKKKK
jgi:ATP-dependent protease ClpP protease subunit